MDTIAELDLLDPASFAGGPPHGYFDHLRRHDPCHEFRAPYGDLFWALTRAAAALDSSVRAAGQDNEHFRGQLINNLT